MKRLIIASAVLVAGMSTAQAATVSCGMGSSAGTPYIKFGEISEGLNLADFGDKGKFGLTAVVNGNNKTATFATTLKYKKVGGRIEFDRETFIRIDHVTVDQWQSEFGLFPQVTCTTP